MYYRPNSLYISFEVSSITKHTIMTQQITLILQNKTTNVIINYVFVLTTRIVTNTFAPLRGVTTVISGKDIFSRVITEFTSIIEEHHTSTSTGLPMTLHDG